MKYCTLCGKEMDDDSLFCTGCGHRLESAAEPDQTVNEPAVAFTDIPPSEPSASAPPPASQPANTQPMASAFEVAHTAATAFTDIPLGEPTASAPPPASQFANTQPMAAVFESAHTAAPPLPYRGVFPEAEPVDEPLPKIKNKREPRVHTGERKHLYTFLNTGMGLILTLLLLCTAALLSTITPLFFDYNNLMNVIKQCALFSLLAIAATLTTRANGLDLSIGPCIAMSSVVIAQTMLMGGSAVSGVLLAASAALLLGLINGFAVVFFKTPALIVTLASGLVVGGVSTAFTQGHMISAQFSGKIAYFASTSIIGVLALLGAAFVLGFLYHLLTRAGKPVADRDKTRSNVSYMFAYLASAEIAAAVGFILLVRFQTAAAATDLQYTAFIIFVYALLTASRVLDNKFAPVLFALVPGIIWGLLSNVFSLWGVYSFYQPVVYSALALLCLMIALLSHYQSKKNALE